MSRRLATVLGCLLPILAGCASSGLHRDASAGGLDTAALALRRGEFDAAREALASVRRTCGDARLGRQALLLSAALELDPRNRDGDSDRAAALAGHWLTLPETFPWTRPLAATLYLQALRAGGRPHSTSGKPTGEVVELLAMVRPAEGAGDVCEASDWEVLGGAALPTLNGRGTPRPASSTAAPGLREDNARLQARVAELEAELQRIRETLRP